jgi:hypothetical protein
MTSSRTKNQDSSHFETLSRALFLNIIRISD